MSATNPLDLAPYNIDSLWLNPAPLPRTLLVVYAHPDDESFGNAGTLARYSAAGVAVHYACATRGEVGTVSPEALDGYPDIGALREHELTCASGAWISAWVCAFSGAPGIPESR